jgi:multisubunit Na+/H+ antiporter MnhB subunit
MTTSQWQPYREPFRSTLLRTVTIAMIAGAIAAAASGAFARWPFITLLALWPALGGHFGELGFLNWLRPRLPGARPVQIAARLAVWFAGGVIFALAMVTTATAIGLRPAHWSAGQSLAHLATLGGLAFIGIELTVHLILQLRGQPSFYNGRG